MWYSWGTFVWLIKITIKEWLEINGMMVTEKKTYPFLVSHYIISLYNLAVVVWLSLTTTTTLQHTLTTSRGRWHTTCQYSHEQLLGSKGCSWLTAEPRAHTHTRTPSLHDLAVLPAESQLPTTKLPQGYLRGSQRTYILRVAAVFTCVYITTVNIFWNTSAIYPTRSLYASTAGDRLTGFLL